jgi:DNA-directed RNA polymerase specialized sigma24 family protein
VANVSKRLNKKTDIESIIKKAVQEGIDAGRKQAERAPDNAYKATERRLYALPVLVRKVEDAQLRLKELEQTGAPGRSKDVIRFARSGVRVSPEEILETLTADIKASIAADEYEIETVKKALRNIENDAYYAAVSGRYFEGISDEEIAKQIPCDERTVRRHRGRLVRVVAVWLYGAEAV